MKLYRFLSALWTVLPLAALAQSSPSMSPMQPAQPMSAAAAPSAVQQPMSHDMGAMQGGPAPTGARDPDAYADGLTLGHMPGMDMADDVVHVNILGNRIEQFWGRQGNGQAISAQGWIGGDLNKFWWKLEGERDAGRLGSTRIEGLWDRAVATYWSVQAGMRHDLGDGPSRNWAAIGFKGLAPYWFDLEGTAYVGSSGRAALRFEAEYDLRITQRWLLQPNIEANFYGKRDPARNIGAGLSDLDAGLRLRYEITRQFAPYLGVTWSRKFGATAGYARDEGGPLRQTRLVAGVRLWF